MSQNRFDTSIPLLTEVLAGSAEDGAPAGSPLQGAPLQGAAAAELAEPETPPQVPAVNYAVPAGRAELDAAGMAALEQRLSERILEQLQGRVDCVLEQAVRDVLAEVVRQSVDRVSTELRVGLQRAMQDMVTQAVSQELAHLRTSRP